MSRGVVNLLGYAGEGTRFIFGPMAAPGGSAATALRWRR
jgi:nucleoside permease NupC